VDELDRVREDLRKDGAWLVPVLEREANWRRGIGEFVGGDSLADVRDAVERLDGMAHLFSTLPDDLLDFGGEYLRAGFDELANDVDYHATAASLDAAAAALLGSLSPLELEISAMGTPMAEEATRLADAYRAALDERHSVAKQIVDRAKGVIKTVSRRIPWAIRLPRIVRVLLIALISLGAWEVGEILTSDTWSLRLLVAAVSFVVVEFVVIELFVERALMRHRRRSLRKLAASVCSEYREAIRRLIILRESMPEV